MPIQTITGRDVQSLNSVEFAAIMNALLRAEAGINGIPIPSLEITDRITDPDGGIDARIDWPASAQHDVLSPGMNGLQYKAGKLSSKILTEEASKADVKDLLRSGGKYVLCVGFDYSQRDAREYTKKLKRFLRNKRLPVSQVMIFTGSQLARWISRFPAVAAMPELRRGIPDFITVDQWRENNKLFTTEFMADAGRKEVMDRIRTFVDSGSTESVLRLEGPAGVGKTRLALESVLDERIASRTLYALTADAGQVEAVVQSFYRDSEITAVLVLDECERSTQDALAQYAHNSNGRLKFICVGIAEVLYASPPPAITPFYQIKPMLNEDVKSVLTSSYPTAAPEFIEVSVRLASGYIKLAVFITDILVRNGIQPTLVIARSPDILSFLKAFVPQETLQSLRVLSVLARIGWEEELQREAKAVAKFVGLKFERLKSEVKKLKDLGVVVPRGRYLYVSPDLLAINAAADLWDSEGSELMKLVEKFPDQEPRRQLMRRLAMLGENQEVKKAVQKILSRDGVYKTLAELNDSALSEAFRILSSTARIEATEVLVALICNASRPELLDFKNGRRNVIWAIESLLRWPETSLDAARVLMRLAICETETIANSATGVLKTYFHILLSGSPLSLTERFTLIDELLDMGDAVARSLAVTCLSGCLEFDEFRMSGDIDPASGSPFPPEWRPKTYDEIWDVRRRALDYLATIAQGGDDAAKSARKAQLHSTTALIQHGQFDDAISLLEATTPVSDEERRVLIDASVRISDTPNLPEETKWRLQKIRESAFGSSFLDRLHRWVGKRTRSDYDLKGNTGYNSADAKTKRLAEEAFENGMNADELQWLSSREAENIWLFGSRLGELDVNGRWQSEIIRATPDNIDCLFLASYIWAREFNGRPEKREEVIDTIEAARPEVAFGVTFRGTPSKAGAERIIRLLSTGRVHPTAIRMLMYGPWLKGIPKSSVVQILELALKHDEPGSLEDVLRIIDTFVHGGEFSLADFGEMPWIALNSTVRGRNSATFGWQWGRVAELLAEQDPIRLTNAFVKQFETDDMWLDMESSFHALDVATKAEPEGVWAIIAKAMMRPDSTGHKLLLKLRHWYGESIPPKILMEWAKKNGPKGFLFAANLLSVKSGQPSESARLLVREAPNQKEVLARIFASLYSGGAFAGPISGFMERQLGTLRELTKDSEPKIREWATAQLRLAEKNLKRQKFLEEEQEF